jgi:hypothetical protein
MLHNVVDVHTVRTTPTAIGNTVAMVMEISTVAAMMISTAAMMGVAATSRTMVANMIRIVARRAAVHLKGIMAVVVVVFPRLTKISHVRFAKSLGILQMSAGGVIQIMVMMMTTTTNREAHMGLK